MECPICGADTQVVRTFLVDARSKTIERKCSNGHKLVYQLIFVREAKRRGDGAYALSQELKKED